MEEQPPKYRSQTSVKDHMDERPPRPSLMTYIIVLIVVAIVVIVVLALLGPSVGNVFSGPLNNL